VCIQFEIVRHVCVMQGNAGCFFKQRATLLRPKRQRASTMPWPTWCRCALNPLVASSSLMSEDAPAAVQEIFVLPVAERPARESHFAKSTGSQPSRLSKNKRRTRHTQPGGTV